MTLVMAACTADGIVVASDSRETNLGSRSSRDDQKKVLRYGNNLMGVCGAGQWLTGPKISAWESAGSALELARLVREYCASTPGFPDAGCVCGNPVDGLAVVQAERTQEGLLSWRSATPIPNRWLAMGLGATTHSLMSFLWNNQLSVAEAAAICWACVRISSEGCNFIGGPVQIEAIFNDPSKEWRPEDVATAEQRGKAWLGKMQRLPWV
jgi:hypothetical protein